MIQETKSIVIKDHMKEDLHKVQENHLEIDKDPHKEKMLALTWIELNENIIIIIMILKI